MWEHIVLHACVEHIGMCGSLCTYICIHIYIYACVHSCFDMLCQGPSVDAMMTSVVKPNEAFMTMLQTLDTSIDAASSNPNMVVIVIRVRMFACLLSFESFCTLTMM